MCSWLMVHQARLFRNYRVDSGEVLRWRADQRVVLGGLALLIKSWCSGSKEPVH